jgi:hypothetical protein
MTYDNLRGILKCDLIQNQAGLVRMKNKRRNVQDAFSFRFLSRPWSELKTWVGIRCINNEPGIPPSSRAAVQDHFRRRKGTHCRTRKN